MGSSKLVTCGNVSGVGTLTLRFEVVRAESVRNAWLASKLVGTFVERYPPQLGCVGAGITTSPPRCSPEATPSHPLAPVVLRRKSAIQRRVELLDCRL
jgi:hypothetical protein